MHVCMIIWLFKTLRRKSMIYIDLAIAFIMLRKLLNTFLYQSMILDVCVNLNAYFLKFKFAAFSLQTTSQNSFTLIGCLRINNLLLIIIGKTYLGCVIDILQLNWRFFISIDRLNNIYKERSSSQFFFLKNGPFPASFSFIFVFSIHSWQYTNVQY